MVGTARTESDITVTISGIEDSGGTGLALVADAMSRADGERVVAAAMERFGRIDILVNNVGGSSYARFLDITDEDFRHTFDWCVTSAFIMSQLAAPHMIAAGHGPIVNISSGSARFGIRALTAYCVAKGGLEALTRAMAQELAPKIRVNAIALGSSVGSPASKRLAPQCQWSSPSPLANFIQFLGNVWPSLSSVHMQREFYGLYG